MALSRPRVLVALLVVVAAPVTTRAQGADLHYDLRADIPVTAAAALGLLGSEALKAHLAATTCRWCDRNADGSDAVNSLDSSVRDALRWHNIDAGNTASNVVGFGLAPVAALGMMALAESHDEGLHRFPVDALLIAEATALAGDLNQIVKFASGRERPFVHVLPPPEKLKTADPADNNTSFPSGHTNLAFALAVSSGTVATMRGYRWAPWVWAVGLTVATGTGYLRIAGDRHYFTDVATGAALGSAIGFAVPYFFHGSTGPRVSVASGARGSGLALAWDFR